MNVNLKVDISVELCDIPDVHSDWEACHHAQALVINGRSPGLAKMLDWKRDNLADYKRLLRSIRLACGQRRVVDPKYVKRSNDRRCEHIYELRAHRGSPRLFFFYSPSGEIIVCTHGWDKKSSQREQGAEFNKAERMRQLYLEHYYEIQTH